MASLVTNINRSFLLKEVQAILEHINDPEIPVLSITDLGIVRGINLVDDIIEIIITPTYSGCPAMDVISMQIRMALLEHGVDKFKITQQLSPAWTTDWMTESGKEKLLSYGIAPPNRKVSDEENNLPLVCPLCNSSNTKLLSEFGSTSCKALYQCQDCKEPFDHFKCH